MAADDPGTRPLQPEEGATDARRDRDFEDVEQHVDEVDRDRPEAHLGDQVDREADAERQTLQGGEGS